MHSPYPGTRATLRQLKECNSSKTDALHVSTRTISDSSTSWSSPVLKSFATRLLNSISETSSSFGSLFFPSTPDGTLTKTSTEDLCTNYDSTPNDNSDAPKRTTLTTVQWEPMPRLPFCEEYDGVNMRRTKTISESIMQILEIRRERDTQPWTGNRLSNENVESPSFDRFKVTHDLNETFQLRALEDDRFSTYDANLCNLSRSLMQSKRSIWADKFKISKVPSIEYYSLSGDCGIEEATVDLEIKYSMDSETLEVTVVRVEDVTDLRDNNKLINSFVQVSLYKRKDRKRQKTKTSKLCRDPIFNQTFKFKNVTQKWFHIECIHLELYRKKSFKNIFLGETRVWIDDLDLFGKGSASVTERFNLC